MLILSALLIPLILALLSTFVRGKWLQGLNLAGGFVLLAISIQLFMAVEQSGSMSFVFGDWPLPYGIEFYVDGLSAILVMLIALISVVVTVFMLNWPSIKNTAAYFSLIQVLVASSIAVGLAADLFNLYVWFELMLIAVMGLLVLGGGRQHFEAALKYFAISMLGTLLMLAAIGMIHGAVGHLNFDAINDAMQQPEVASKFPFYGGLFILAMLLKVGAFPLFAWLPAAYHLLPAPLLALVGGLLTKLSIYIILRLSGQVFELNLFYDALGWLAVITMISGVLGAAYHWDLRRILAFHIVSQVGFLLLGIALASPAGATGTAFFLFHNILVKANLFLIAGVIWMTAGHYDLRRIGGLFPARPLLSVMFLLSALSLVGVPPTSGFWGKLLIISESLDQQHYWWAAAALFTGMLTLYSMSKIWLEGFWKAHPDNTVSEQAVSYPVYAVMLLMSMIILFIGLTPDFLISFLQSGQQGFYGG